MKTWTKYWTGLALLTGLTPGLWAQPAIPSAPAAPAAAAAPAAPAPGGLLGLLGLGADQRAACKAKLCASPLGQMLNNSAAPLSAFTGGIVGSCCPPVNAADLKKPADSAEGAAARIKQDEAECKARRAAVRYLGTVDCNWWPEAEDGLINALRKDKCECVRLEAAWALTRGCCCTKKTVAALKEVVEGGKKLGSSPENSERVKDAAAVALERCLACLPPEPEKGEKSKEAPGQKSPEKPKPEGDQELPKAISDTGNTTDKATAALYKQIEATPWPVLIEQARQALAEAHGGTTIAMASMTAGRVDHSLSGIIASAQRANPSAKSKRVLGGTTVVQVAANTSESSAATMPATGQPIIDAPPAPAVTRTTYAPHAATSQASAAVPPSMPGPSMAKIQEWMSVLTTSTYPELREFAAKNLAECDWRTYPQAAQALLTASYKDSSPLVRIACIRSLVRMDVKAPAVAETLEAMKTDADPKIRDEANQALVKLGLGQGN